MEKPKIYFSYSRADSEFVLRLAKDLRSAGVDLWIDQLDIGAGDRWDQAVEDALKAAPCMLVVVSPASVESHYVKVEVSLAFDDRKKIVPVLAGKCTIPSRLRRLDHVDFTIDYDKGLNRLLEALRPLSGPWAGKGRNGSERPATEAVAANEATRTLPQKSPKGTTPRRYVTASVGVLALAATAGGISFVLVLQYMVHSNEPNSAQDWRETKAIAPASPDPGQPAKFHPNLNEAATASAPPPRETVPKARVIPPPSVPTQPMNGTWDVTMRCRDGSAVNEYGAIFTGGTYARTYQLEQGSINTQLALGYINKNSIRLTGFVVSDQLGVQAVDATGKKKGSSFVGLGTIGTSTKCTLTITDRN